MDLTLLIFILLPVAAVSYKVVMPSEVWFKMGDRRTLTCSMRSCPGEVKFSWTSLEDKPLFATVDNKHAESLLIFESVMKNHENTVVCKATCGKDSKQATAAIKVYSFQRNPVIIGNEHMILGEENILTCEVSHVYPSEYLEVKLLYEDKVLVSKEGEEDGTDSLKISHTFQPSSEDDGKEITCRASLNVEDIPHDERTKKTSGHLRVLSAPHNLRISGLTAVSLGSSLTLTCEAEGSPELEFTWTALKPDGQSVEMGKRREMSIPNVTLTDAGVYQCEVSNNLGRQTKRVSVVVQAPPMNTIIEASQQTVLKEGQSISIFCKSDGVPVDRVVLRRMLDSRTTELKSSVGSETSFTFESVEVSDSGFYECTAFNKFGSQSASLNLTVEAYLLEVELQPSDAIVAESGSSLTLSCNASGCPQPTFTWKSLGNLPNRGLIKTDGLLSKLFLDPVEVEDEGTYICEVTCGSAAKSKQTKVNVFSFPTSPVVESPGPSLEGEMIRLTCTVLDVFPTNFFRIVWTDGEGELHSESGMLSSHLQNLTSVLSYHVEAKDQDKLMTCKVLLDMNGVPTAQTVKTASTALSVHYPPRGTRITVIPQGELKEGESVSISCLSDSVPVGRVELIRVVDGIETELMARDGVETLVILTPLELGDSGLYVCKASNRHGSESDSVEIKVKAPPRNTTVEVFPSSEVQEGQNITICCNSVSFPPPAVVLRKLDSESVIYSPDGVFQLINLTANDTGMYQVNVTNDLGYETEIFIIHVMEKRFVSPPSWTDFITPAICLGATAALVGIMVYLWRDRKKGSYDLTKCNPDTV
ncbi:vascular cell adhesion protein 1b isoform X4 [Paramisgurnus dabryanus]|uniref:vascular cell adhesion protein 1b isoform X4 n=1 Tax=Paramisgurnus dabryanus TaxID=90735 RepID=UPI0031F45759